MSFENMENLEGGMNCGVAYGVFFSGLLLAAATTAVTWGGAAAAALTIGTSLYGVVDNCRK